MNTQQHPTREQIAKTIARAVDGMTDDAWRTASADYRGEMLDGADAVRVLFGDARVDALQEAAAIARDVKRRELELHQCPFDEMPQMNRHFVYGAIRAAEQIEAARSVDTDIKGQAHGRHDR